MSESSIATARQALLEAWVALEVVSGSVSGQDAIDQLLFLRSMSRRADYGSLRIVAQLDSDGEFAERGVRPAAGVADLLRCTRVEARRMVAVAASVPDLVGRCGVGASVAGDRDSLGWLGDR